MTERTSPTNRDAEWTGSELKSYFEMVFAEREKASLAAFSAAEKAVSVALTAQEKAVAAAFMAQEKAVSAALSAAEKAVAAALHAADRAVAKAESTSQARFESVNEFRQSLNDMITHLIPREEANSRMNAIAEKIETIATRLTAIEGRSTGLAAGWGYIIGGCGLVATLIGIIIAFKT